MGAHRNVFEENRIVDNGHSAKGSAARAAIVMRGHHHDVVFRRNTIGNSSPGTPAGAGILASPQATGLVVEANEFVNVKAEVERDK